VLHASLSSINIVLHACRHNEGTYVQTKGLMEQVLANKMIAYMKEREADGKPFMIYYAPYAIHRK
jgi:hypothetical protein